MKKKGLFVIAVAGALLAACSDGSIPVSAASSSSEIVSVETSSEKVSSEESSVSSSEAVSVPISVQADERIEAIHFYDSFDGTTLGNEITSWGSLTEIYATIAVKEGSRLKPMDPVSSVKGTFTGAGYGSVAGEDGTYKKVYRIVSAAESAEEIDPTDSIVLNIRTVRSVTASVEHADFSLLVNQDEGEGYIEDDAVFFSLTQEDGYSVTGVKAKGKTSGTELEITRDPERLYPYSFTMIDEDVEITATLAEAAKADVSVSNSVSYVSSYSLVGERSGVSLFEDGTASFEAGEMVDVEAYVSSYEKTLKAKLGDEDVELSWSGRSYTGSFVVPSGGASFSFIEGDAQEKRTISFVSLPDGVSVSYWTDSEDPDTKTSEAPDLYDHQLIYIQLNEAAPDGKAYAVEAKGADDDEYTEIDPEEDHLRMYAITIEGDEKVRVSLEDAAVTHTVTLEDTNGNLGDEDVIFQIKDEDEPIDVTYAEIGNDYSIEDGSSIRISSDGVAGIYKFGVTMDGEAVEATDSDGNPVYFTVTGDVVITVGDFLED